MKPKERKTTPSTVTQLAAAMKALGAYSGDNTEAEHEIEAKRIGAGKDYYRMRLANALLGIVETETMMLEVASPSTDLMLHAHQQALESEGAMDTKEKLLGFLRWQVLRIEGPLRQIAQDKETGPIPLAAAHAAEGLQQLLGFCVNDKHTNPETLDPSAIKSDLKKARESLTDAIANIDVMLGLITKAEELFNQPETRTTAPKTTHQYNNRTQRISKLLLLDMLVPLCVEKRTTEFFIPPVDPAQFQRKGKE